MKVEMMSIRSGALVHCPWNPRGEITPESVADLTASIREKGLLQDIGVMPIPDEPERYWVIYGNRRFVACVGAGMGDVPCKLYTGLTEQDAREITRIENEVRLGVDPMRDAELLHSFIVAGRTYEDVALMFGTSPATVCRREKLVSLDESVRKIIDAKPGQIATNALEHIACYPPEIQKKCAGTLKAKANYSRIGWTDVRHVFEGATRDLDTAPFIKKGHGLKCVGCPKRTGCQQNLFGELEGDGKLGRCLDAECFEKQRAECISEELARLIPDGVERVRADYPFQIEGPAWGPKKTKARPACWYWTSAYDCSVKVAWGPSKAAMDASIAEEQRMREDARQASAAKRAVVESAVDKLHALFDLGDDNKPSEKLEEILGKYFGTDSKLYVGRFLQAVVMLGISPSGDADTFNWEQVRVYPVRWFVELYAGAIEEETNGWGSENFCKRLVTSIYETRDVLTNDEQEALMDA